MDRSLTELLSEKSLFGKRLRERRLFLKLSQESLGVSIGLDESCSKTRISRYESGMHEPKLPTARLLANSLGVPLTYLYCEKKNPIYQDLIKRLVIQFCQSFILLWQVYFVWVWYMHNLSIHYGVWGLRFWGYLCIISL